MVDCNRKYPAEQNLALGKSQQRHLDEIILHNLGDVDASMHMGSERGNLLSIENSGLYTPEVWFSNSLGSEQTTASPIMIGGSALSEDELWSDFLSQQTSASVADVEMPDGPGSLLSEKNPETAELLTEMDTAQRSTDIQNLLHLQLSNPVSSPRKTKGVHWPEDIRQEKELKRQRSGFHSPSLTAIMDNLILNTDSPERCAAVEVETTLPEDFLKNLEHVLKETIPSRVPNSSLDKSESESFSLQEVLEIGVSQVGVVVTSRSISEKASANGLESPGSDKSKDHSSSGNNNAGNLVAMPASVAVAQALTSTDFLDKGSEEKDQKLSPNLTLPPVGPVKNGVQSAPKSHYVQLVERNTGVRMISTAGDSSLPRESRWAEQLLLECAQAISSKNFVRTQHLMWVLNDLGSLTGDANQRLAAHGLKSLFCKVTGTVAAAGSNPALGQVDAGPKTVHRALLKFHDVNPWHHMLYTVANSIMIDNFEGEEKVHVIDVGVSQGTQWPTFIEALATRASGPPVLKLTVVKDEEGVGTPGVPQGPSSTDFMAQLERFAKLMGINIELHTVVSSLENLTRDKLGLTEGEALAVCAQFRLHRLPETVETGELDEVSHDHVKPALSPRDKFLHFLHELQPKVVILSENDTDHLSPDFVTRFRPAMDYFWKFLDSTSFSFHGRQSQERQIIEYEAAMAMINNVACEGSHRIERNESHAGWKLRMERARFVSVLPREEILENIRTLIRKYDTNWDYGIDTDCVVLLWKHQPVTFCSVWKPAQHRISTS